MTDLAFIRWLQSSDPTPPELPDGPLADIAPLIADLHGPERIERCHEELNKLDGPGKEAWRRLGLAMNEIDAPANDAEGRKIRWTFDELLSTDFPEPEWIINGILPVGLVILAGKPKVGKSFLALQLAHAVGSGGHIFGQQVKQRKVLYLALEDPPRRLKDRLRKQGAESGIAAVAMTDWPKFGASGGGIELLREQIDAEGFGLVIVDTLSRAAGMSDQLDVAAMTALLDPLQRIAQERNMTILVIDHHPKASGFDNNPVMDIFGSVAKGAVPDGAMGLYTQQGKRGATLAVAGRELEGAEFALEFDGMLGTWQLLGEAGTVKKETLKAAMPDAIRELVYLGELPSTKKLSEYLDEPKGSVSKALGELLIEAKVVKGDKVGRQIPYYTPDTLPPEQASLLEV